MPVASCSSSCWWVTTDVSEGETLVSLQDNSAESPDGHHAVITCSPLPSMVLQTFYSYSACFPWQPL